MELSRFSVGYAGLWGQHSLDTAALIAKAAEVPYLEMQIAYVEALARIGAELGASVVRVFTAYEVEGESPQTTWGRVVTALREACDRAVKFSQGFIDYPAFFQGLKEGGFDGIANYEMCSPVRGGGSPENLDAYAAHYVRWMREHVLGDAG